MLKTPNISEVISENSNTVNATLLSKKLAALEPSDDSMSGSDDISVHSADYVDFEQSTSQPVSSHQQGTPLTVQSDRVTDLKSPETQIGLL